MFLCSKVTKSKVKTKDTNTLLTGTKNPNFYNILFFALYLHCYYRNSKNVTQKAEAIHKIRVKEKYQSVKPNIKHEGLVSQTGLRINQD